MDTELKNGDWRHSLAVAILVAMIISSGIVVRREFRILRHASSLGTEAIAPDNGPRYSEVTNGAVILSSHAEVLRRRDELVQEGRDFIMADLAAKVLTVYESGEPTASVPIRATGRSGSFFETPNGVYQVKLLEGNHFSLIGKVWMPWSVHFYGNYFIHGWPYYPNGEPVAETFSGGCIRLSTRDAEIIYEKAKPGMPVLVLAEAVSSPVEFTYFRKVNLSRRELTAKLSARAALAADLETGKVLFEQNRSVAYPIASVTKLMSSLVALEAINRFRVLKVSSADLAMPGDVPPLEAGDAFESQELIYPLLLASSNDVAALYERSNWRFVDLMNQKAAAIGLVSTQFVDASGLDVRNVSTAEDLFRLIRYLAVSKRPLYEIAGERQHTFVAENTGRRYELVNGNWPLDDDRFLAGKAGKTSEAGEAMVGVFRLKLSESGERSVAVIVLRSRDRVQDVNAVIDYLEDNFVYGMALARDVAPPTRIPADANLYEAVRGLGSE